MTDVGSLYFRNAKNRLAKLILTFSYFKLGILNDEIFQKIKFLVQD